MLAERSIQIRAGRATHIVDLWREAATSGTALAGADVRKVEPFIRTAAGLPSAPLPDDHLQGHVAELTWYVLVNEVDPGMGRTLRRVEKPSFFVTSPGGDGLATYELADGSLAFRIWEIKKHTGTRHLSTTVTRACDQLGRRGVEYLAQYVSLAPETDPQLANLYARLVDLWVDDAPVAGAGVAIGTSHAQAPQRRCFTGMQRHFPGLSNGGQLEGMVAAISDFPAFCGRVREFMWSAL